MIESQHEYYNKNFTFEKFFVTPENRSAYEEALIASQHPGKTYNPLVICSPVGAGKTHLLYAIVNKVKTFIPRTRILFITSIDFTNAVIKSIRNGDIAHIRESCNDATLLCLDSFQYFADKERTQEELCRLCAGFLKQKKQIAISSDYPLKMCKGISTQLQSLFARGVTVCIQPPNTELKLSILKKMAKSKKIKLPQEVSTFIVNQAGSNIRVVQGLLFRLISCAKFEQKPIDLEMAKKLIEI